jgi:predicted site-specific integrase-resolvase
MSANLMTQVAGATDVANAIELVSAIEIASALEPQRRMAYGFVLLAMISDLI